MLAFGGGLAGAQDLCGRPREAPDALLQRLTRTEKLPESGRDAGYVTVIDKEKGILWSFTRAGHPAHPSVVCRQPVEAGGKVSIDMAIQCEASDDSCAELAGAFESLNQKMIEDALRQAK
jgi:hypothetical protein